MFHLFRNPTDLNNKMMTVIIIYCKVPANEKKKRKKKGSSKKQVLRAWIIYSNTCHYLSPGANKCKLHFEIKFGEDQY